MDPLGPGLAVDPDATLLFCGFVGGGVALGTVSGLTPGIHANTFALLLAGVAPSIPGPVRYVGAAMLAAGVVHTFLDVVPALALGVPDPAMASSALPGHRLVLAGRGREALRLSALGSAGAVAFAVPLAVPMTSAMTAVYPTLRAHLPLLLGVVVVVLVVTESTTVGRVGAALSVAASGALGAVALDLPPGGLVESGGMLAPIFTGLFGAPVLLDALTGEGVPPQDDANVTASRRSVVGFALAGTLSGAVVGYVPGVSSAIAATVALLAVPGGGDGWGDGSGSPSGGGADGARGFVVTTSGVNTANTVFALLALIALGTPRTGVMVAMRDAGVPLDLPLLLGSVLVAAACGFALVVTLGDSYLRLVGRADYTRLSVSVLCLVVVVVAVLTGPLGVAVLGGSTVVGLVPARFGARRASLMGVLLVPLIFGL
ncbi:tripartite tricarboxylate transporter permease [Halosimplex litoreum]|uniref:Tripartite tricarboxylate transporter permease n=1 Tax=Halosimplex litoreum TaxID=1198301 RepID=A0A7T3KVN0_9EURY|nr:tripartite tricarboxylate transporter permease [Halosimplex litoreum]QPV63462.1 tripartite tricarboxylate transporter permease [Halosimplex litoreum]